MRAEMTSRGPTVPCRGESVLGVLVGLVLTFGCDTVSAPETRAQLLIAADTIPASSRATIAGSGETLSVALNLDVPAVLSNTGKTSIATSTCGTALEELREGTWVTAYLPGCLDAATADYHVDVAPGETRTFTIFVHAGVSGPLHPIWNSQSDIGTFRVRLGLWTPGIDGPTPLVYSNSFVITRF